MKELKPIAIALSLMRELGANDDARYAPRTPRRRFAFNHRSASSHSSGTKTRPNVAAGTWPEESLVSHHAESVNALGYLSALRDDPHWTVSGVYNVMS